MSYLHGKKDIDGSLVVEDKVHYQVHQGNAYMAHHNSSALGTGATINIYLKAPASGRVHLNYDAHGSSSFDIEVLEAPTVTSGTGTQGSVYNRDRDSVNTSGVLDNTATPVANKVTLDATITADGTIIRSDVYGSNKSQGDLNSREEIILAQDTVYVFRLTSQASNNRVHINLDWYEV